MISEDEIFCISVCNREEWYHSKLYDYQILLGLQHYWSVPSFSNQIIVSSNIPTTLPQLHSQFQKKVGASDGEHALNPDLPALLPLSTIDNMLSSSVKTSPST